MGASNVLPLQKKVCVWWGRGGGAVLAVLKRGNTTSFEVGKGHLHFSHTERGRGTTSLSTPIGGGGGGRTQFFPGSGGGGGGAQKVSDPPFFFFI